MSRVKGHLRQEGVPRPRPARRLQGGRGLPPSRPEQMQVGDMRAQAHAHLPGGRGLRQGVGEHVDYSARWIPRQSVSPASPSSFLIH